ncbi:hypothetical protein GCM10020367_19350 [Streptomyces sannanensis]|uniref:Integral membrane protein n=1 Tax=Streptomyces sannanensis TaxID=285536 RepID=A0ABP6S8X9_9ACTN
MRFALPLMVIGEVGLVICLMAGVPVPVPLLAGAEVVVFGALTAEAVVVWRRSRVRGFRAAVRSVIPEKARRLAAHELRSLHSLGLWVARRQHGVRDGDHSVAYTGPQTAMMYGLVFVSLVETVVLALVVPWPTVHRILLVLDAYGLLLVFALHAACVTRPHVVEADGSLRIRYGAMVDLRVGPADIAGVRVERRYPEGKLVQLGPDGVLDLAVGSQTTVTLELNRAVEFVRPLGARCEVRTVRFHADDPRALVAALTQA